MSSAKYPLGVLGIAVLAAAACGGTATELGSSKNEDDAGSSTGGTATDGATSSSGGGVATDAGTAGGTGGTASGATGGTGGSGGMAADAGPMDVCMLPAPIPSTPEEIERDSLIRAYCTALLGAGCSYGAFEGRVSTEMANCSYEDRLRACVIDTYNDYEAHITTPECDALWRAAAECVGSVDYSVAGCPDLVLISNGGGAPGRCDAEKYALGACTLALGGGLTGSRAYCNYGPDPFETGGCAVLCDLGGNYFEAKCGGAAGLPLSCDCFLNTHYLWDDGDAMAAPFLAADCRDAAARMADGTCLDRVDCCFTWLGSETPQTQHCSCTSDPTKVGYESCEAAATALGGSVVELCPQYEKTKAVFQAPAGRAREKLATPLRGLPAPATSRSRDPDASAAPRS